LNESHGIKDWENKQLEELVVKMSNGTTETQIESVTPYPVTRIETISEGKINPKKVKYLKSPINVEKYRLKEGDILFSHINSIEHIGKTAIYENKPEFLLHGMNLLLLRPNLEKIDYRYFFQYLNWGITRNKFRSLAKKAVNQASINTTELGSLTLPVPPLVEQRGIAEVLGTVDEAIRRTDAVIEKAEELKRGLMQRLLARGIGHTEFKQTELGEIPKTWEIKKIDEICNVVRGASPRPIGDPTYFSEKGRGWIRISDVTSTYKYLQETTQYLSEKGVSKSRKVDPGDLIMSICATIGKPIILDMKACIHDGFVLFDGLSNEVDKEFLFYLLQSKETDFIGKKQVGTQGNLNTTIVGKTKIILPPMEEQKKITEICRKCDDKIFMEKKNKEKMNNVKNGLMQALLSGKVRVELREDGLHRIGDG
jgi:type I restriction enzyme S subunit